MFVEGEVMVYNPLNTPESVSPDLVPIAFNVAVLDITNGPLVPFEHVPAGEDVGVEPSIVPQIVAPEVTVEQVTVCVEVKVPALGEHVGVATIGLIV